MRSPSTRPSPASTTPTARSAIAPARRAPPRLHQRQVQWDEPREIVLDSYRSCSPQMADIAGGFSDRYIDAAPSPGKQGGAFSHPAVPSAHPYVLLNFTANRRAVMTLAHELGHG